MQKQEAASFVLSVLILDTVWLHLLPEPHEIH